MKKKLALILLSASISLGVLSACNADNNEPEDVNYDPVNDNNQERGPDIDTDPSDVRHFNEPDTPFNMDEEEPDPDEEPSEERRGL